VAVAKSPRGHAARTGPHLANVLCFFLTTKAGWRTLAAEVGFSIRDEGTFNGMWFAVAPFVGALGALVLGDRPGSVTTVVAAALFIASMTLHLTEKHRHEHAHEELSHDHAHSHDDGHHDHDHDVPPDGPHAHAHQHDVRVHVHPHGPDAHHGPRPRTLRDEADVTVRGLAFLRGKAATA
jgi:hypothetical protein